MERGREDHSAWLTEELDSVPVSHQHQGFVCCHCLDLGHGDVVLHCFIFNNTFLYLYQRLDFVMVCCNLRFMNQFVLCLNL